MQPIASLSSSAVDYLITFNARAVAIAPNGFVYTSNNPTGAAAAWWCRHDDALRLAKAAHASGDIEGVAKRLHIQLTEHAVVLERVQARTQRLDEALQRAQDAGLLAAFQLALPPAPDWRPDKSGRALHDLRQRATAIAQGDH